MSKRNLLNLVLFGVVAALVLVTVYEPGKKEAPANPRLTQLQKDSINKIHLKRSDKQDVTLE